MPIRQLVAAPTAVPAATAGFVGEFASASVEMAMCDRPGHCRGAPPAASPAAAQVAAAAAVAAVVGAPSQGLDEDQPLGHRLGAENTGLPRGCPFLAWRGAGWSAGCFSQHVVHHCGQFVRQDLVGGRGGK
jgi:hypothetical protein